MPASTIRRVRKLHNLDQSQFAVCFLVSTRTVIRWEQRGLDPDDLERDPDAIAGPEWRRELLRWFLSRDTRKQEAPCPEPAP